MQNFILKSINEGDSLISYSTINNNLDMQIAHIEAWEGTIAFENKVASYFKKTKYVSFRNKYAKDKFFKEFCILFENGSDKVAFIRIACAIFSYKALLFLEEEGFFNDLDNFTELMKILDSHFGDFHTARTDRSYNILLKATKKALKLAKS